MNYIENTMYSGYMKPDTQYYQPFRYKAPDHYDCPRCGLEMSLKATVYEWDDKHLCGECMVDSIHHLLPWERAEMCGESISVTEQLMTDANGDANKIAAMLDIDTKKAEEVA